MLDGTTKLVENPYGVEDGFMSPYVVSNMPYVGRAMTDEDGDGVEDNVHFTSQELDRFYKPPVFGPADEMHNTQHGNLPGHK